MGEQQEKDKKNNEGEKKVESGVATTVFKFDMHCEGCAKKIRKSLKNFQGVESVKTDCSTNKLVVTGNVDPVKIKERVEQKMKKKVELVSQQPITPAKEGGNGGQNKSDDKKPEEKKSGDKKSEDKKDKEKTKEISIATVQLKTRVHCEGCANKIKKIVSKCEGVQDVNVDLQKDLITAKGTMDIKELLPYLNLKLKRTVELAPSKKEDGSSGDKKPKEGGGGAEKPKEGNAKAEKTKESSDEKKKEGGGDISKDNATKIEVSKMEYSPFSYEYGYAPIYDPRVLGEGSSSGSGYGHQVVQYWHEPEYSHPPQMFSDENPNACSVM
ncbi:hypothetical protein KSS87_021607 [Heliosperma pusillum]|nr:hypothetical protein KSS87_021607 [Heliosperma pusillum]